MLAYIAAMPPTKPHLVQVRDELWSILTMLRDHEFASSFLKPVNVATTEGWVRVLFPASGGSVSIFLVLFSVTPKLSSAHATWERSRPACSPARTVLGLHLTLLESSPTCASSSTIVVFLISHCRRSGEWLTCSSENWKPLFETACPCRPIKLVD
jgi:hypothetical protein